MEYLREPVFWISVIVVALVVNFVYSYLTGKKKLV